MNAKIEFPGLYYSFPARGIPRAGSENDTLLSTPEAHEVASREKEIEQNEEKSGYVVLLTPNVPDGKFYRASKFL